MSVSVSAKYKCVSCFLSADDLFWLCRKFRIFVSARWNKSIWNCETNISAYLNADYFLQMIHIHFAESLRGFKVSVRIFVSEIVWLISNLSANLYADYFLQMMYFDFWGLNVSNRILVSSRENTVYEIAGQISLQYVDSKRNTKEGATNEEFEIASNGPNISKCNSVVKEAMNIYWSTWHISGSNVIEKLKSSRGDIEVTDRIMNTKKQLPLCELND